MCVIRYSFARAQSQSDFDFKTIYLSVFGEEKTA